MIGPQWTLLESPPRVLIEFGMCSTFLTLIKVGSLGVRFVVEWEITPSLKLVRSMLETFQKIFLLVSGAP